MRKNCSLQTQRVSKRRNEANNFEKNYDEKKRRNKYLKKKRPLKKVTS